MRICVTIILKKKFTAMTLYLKTFFVLIPNFNLFLKPFQATIFVWTGICKFVQIFPAHTAKLAFNGRTKELILECFM